MTFRLSRREVLGAAALGIGGIGAGVAVGAQVNESAAPSPAKPVTPTGAHQAGIARPSPPQAFSLTVVSHLPDDADVRDFEPWEPDWSSCSTIRTPTPAT